MSKLAMAIIGICGFAAAGCQSASSPDDTGSLFEQPVTPMVHEAYTGFREPARMVVRNSRDWAEVWVKTFLPRTEPPHRPSIDFSREVVLVAAQGGQGSSGYDISIDRVASSYGAIAVNVTSTSPGERCGVLTVITSPVMMVRIPRPAGHVRFIEHTRVLPCD